MVGEAVPVQEVQGQEVFLTPTQYDELKTIDQEQHTELMEKLDTLILQQKETNTDLSVLDESIKNINLSIPEGTVFNIDNSELVSKLDELNSLINSFTEPFSWVVTASSAITTYAVFYVPLLIIVWALWWFFKQFIRV